MALDNQAQIEIYARLIKIAKKGDRHAVIAAIKKEIEALNMLFEFTAEKPKNEAKEKFELFWKNYPKRDGSNPKAVAQKVFMMKLRLGADADHIIQGAKSYAQRESKRIGTVYIAQAMTWLRQDRWHDYLVRATGDSKEQRRQAAIEEMRANGHI
jgi:hypothetical protein